MKKQCKHFNTVTVDQVTDGRFVITHFKCEDCGHMFGRYVPKDGSAS